MMCAQCSKEESSKVDVYQVPTEYNKEKGSWIFFVPKIWTFWQIGQISRKSDRDPRNRVKGIKGDLRSPSKENRNKRKALL